MLKMSLQTNQHLLEHPFHGRAHRLAIYWAGKQDQVEKYLEGLEKLLRPLRIRQVTNLTRKPEARRVRQKREGSGMQKEW